MVCIRGPEVWSLWLLIISYHLDKWSSGRTSNLRKVIHIWKWQNWEWYPFPSGFKDKQFPILVCCQGVSCIGYPKWFLWEFQQCYGRKLYCIAYLSLYHLRVAWCSRPWLTACDSDNECFCSSGAHLEVGCVSYVGPWQLQPQLCGKVSENTGLSFSLRIRTSCGCLYKGAWATLWSMAWATFVQGSDGSTRCIWIMCLVSAGLSNSCEKTRDGGRGQPWCNRKKKGGKMVQSHKSKTKEKRRKRRADLEDKPEALKTLSKSVNCTAILSLRKAFPFTLGSQRVTGNLRHPQYGSVWTGKNCLGLIFLYQAESCSSPGNLGRYLVWEIYIFIKQMPCPQQPEHQVNDKLMFNKSSRKN